MACPGSLAILNGGFLHAVKHHSCFDVHHTLDACLLPIGTLLLRLICFNHWNRLEVEEDFHAQMANILRIHGFIYHDPLHQPIERFCIKLLDVSV